mmetsp:Transcript_28963/g.73486  ORF Transcript_28963/g.73486 Transcript_28963/m.73486 type:complete len:246 (+) Transcript_28963:2100-2837(+)
MQGLVVKLCTDPPARVLDVVGEEVLDRGHHPLGLHAADARGAHLAVVQRVLAVRLLGAAPVQPRQDVDRREEGALDVELLGDLAHGRSKLLLQLDVPRGGAQALRGKGRAGPVLRAGGSEREGVSDSAGHALRPIPRAHAPDPQPLVRQQLEAGVGAPEEVDRVAPAPEEVLLGADVAARLEVPLPEAHVAEEGQDLGVLDGRVPRGAQMRQEPQQRGAGPPCLERSVHDGRHGPPGRRPRAEET